jgi:hypothetical protein
METCRRFPRTEMALRVDFRVSGQQMERKESRTEIVGGGGLMMTSPFYLPTGTKVEMNLYHDSFVIPFEAEVVWIDPAKKDETPKYKCGFQYVTDSKNGLMHILYLLQSKLQDQ